MIGWVIGGTLAYALIGVLIGVFALAWSRPERMLVEVSPPSVDKADVGIAIGAGALWPITICLFIWILVLPEKKG
jgi:hypothetical protein